MLPRLSHHHQSSGADGNSNRNVISRIIHENNAKQYEEKYEEELVLNMKLKELYRAIKANVDNKVSANEEVEELKGLLKEKKKYDNDYEHQCQLLNFLISENSKLKDQVNSERNKRAIYFNIYKNLQHEIHLWEGKYKNQLIQFLKTEGVMIKIKQKTKKAINKIKKQIVQLNKQIEKENKIINHQIDLCKMGENQHKNQTNTKKNKQSDNPKARVTFNKFEEETILQLEQRKTNVLQIVDQIKKICDIQDLEQLKIFWEDIDKNTEEIYNKFQEEEKKDKDLSQTIENLQSKLNKLNQNSQERKATIKQENLKIVQANNLSLEITDLQEKISELVGIKVKDLPNDMVMHYCLRIKEERNHGKKQGRKNLQKILEQSKKEKIECALILSPKQMHKRVIEEEANQDEME